MKRGPRLLVAAGLAVVGVWAMGALTRVEYRATPPDRAELRLAWRARVARVEECRRLSEAEQAELPAHMRREEVCEGRVASYELRVEVDGSVRHRSVVEGAGARGDRPLYVFEATPLEPGRHRVRVTFERVDGGRAALPGESEVPDRLVLEEAVRVSAGDVVLVRYDPDARALVLAPAEGE